MRPPADTFRAESQSRKTLPGGDAAHSAEPVKGLEGKKARKRLDRRDALARALSALSRRVQRGTIGADDLDAAWAALAVLDSAGGSGGAEPTPGQVHTHGGLRHQTLPGASAGRERRLRWHRRHGLHGCRAPLGRGSRAGWESWVNGMADEFRRHGRPELAMRAASCGRWARSWDCGACGATDAHVEVRVSCCLRTCPWCARQKSRETVRIVAAAAENVPALCRAAAERLAPELRRELQDPATPEARRAALRPALDGCEHLDGWRWSLVTVSPPWRPEEEGEYTVERLEERAADALARWTLAWSALGRMGGAGAAWARVELSPGGHVHVHALVCGPFRPVAAWARAAGCFVDVRAVDSLAGGIEECCKYAAKTPSPLRAAWIAGEGPRHRANLAHPALAARWTLALRRVRAERSYGPFVDAIRAARLADKTSRGAQEEAEKERAPRRCADCGATIPAADCGRIARTADLARELAGRWGERARKSRVAEILGGVPGGVIPPRLQVITDT